MDASDFIQHCNRTTKLPAERKDCILHQVQEHVTFKYIPLFTYLTVVTVVGVIGNSLILAVYFRRARKTATIVFIEAIAVTDLLTNVLVIPVTFHVLMTCVTVETYLCRIYYFLNYTTSTISVVLLLAVAVVRYRKICLPFGRQVTNRHARLFSVAIALICVTLCVPHTIVSGRGTVEKIISENITIYECAIDDSMVDTYWPKVITGFSILIFLSCCIPLTVMYSQIGIEAQRRRPCYGASIVSRFDKSEDFGGKPEIAKELARTKGQVEKDKVTSSLSRDNDTTLSDYTTVNETDLHRNESFYLQRSHRGANVLNRTTVMLITISAIYILTNLTTLVLIWVRSALKIKIGDLSTVNTALFSVFLYSFAINSAVNGIIYIALDRNFRIDCLKLIKRL